MKYREIKFLSPEERRSKLVIEEGNLRKLRFAHAISPIENPMRIKYSRRLIAQLKTAENAPQEIRK
ncbi:MAG: 50S ribosomal protein L29 [Amoebophilaceae bacterium]|jgi:large subunit ribosomal protein L29|nr:50S ribosomal protein L29 [Amoebophilaceae bacterium]